MKGNHCRNETKQEILDDMKRTEERTGWNKAKIYAWYGVTKSTVHRWEKDVPARERRGINPYAILEEEVNAVIEYRLRCNEHREMSYKKLTYKMMDEDIVYLSPSSVYRILKKSRLLGPSYKGKGDANDEYQEKPQYVHHHWHVDIAYVKIYGEFYYLIVIIDGFSRYVLGWKLMLDMTQLSTHIFFQKASDSYPEENPKVIHDHGVQFVSYDFKKLLRETRCIDVPTKVKHPETNGKVERFFGVVRQEALWPNSPVTLSDAESVIKEFVEYYNNRRLHSGIGYVRVADVFFGKNNEILNERKKKLADAKRKRIELNHIRYLKSLEGVPA